VPAGRFPASRWWQAIALCAAVVVLAGLAQTGAGHALLRGAGLFQSPTGYTALSFLHPQAPIARNAKQRSAAAVSFKIHNANAGARDYHWSVFLVHDGRRRTVGSGDVHVTAGHQASIIRSLKTGCTTGQTQLIVGLALPAESIDAWTSCLLARS
jgi:hypothetical protein